MTKDQRTDENFISDWNHMFRQDEDTPSQKQLREQLVSILSRTLDELPSRYEDGIRYAISIIEGDSK